MSFLSFSQGFELHALLGNNDCIPTFQLISRLLSWLLQIILIIRRRRILPFTSGSRRLLLRWRFPPPLLQRVPHPRRPTPHLLCAESNSLHILNSPSPSHHPFRSVVPRASTLALDQLQFLLCFAELSQIFRTNQSTKLGVFGLFGKWQVLVEIVRQELVK